jgi:hypothetical protein
MLLYLACTCFGFAWIKTQTHCIQLQHYRLNIPISTRKCSFQKISSQRQ